MQFKLIIVLLSALFVAVFALQNSVPVFINFFAWQFETKIAIVILAAVAFGALCIGILSFFKQIGVGVRNLNQQSKIKKLESEIDQLKEEILGLEVTIGSLEKEKLCLLTENRKFKSDPAQTAISPDDVIEENLPRQEKSIDLEQY